MAINYNIKKGTETDKQKHLEDVQLSGRDAVIERAKVLSRENDDFIEIYRYKIDRKFKVSQQIAAVVHTKVIDKVNQFMGNGVYTTGAKVELD